VDERSRSALVASTTDTYVFVQLAYATILSRTASPDEIDHWCDAIRVGHWTRSEVLQDFVSSPEFREKASVEQAVRAGVESERWTIGTEPLWPGRTERVVETSWVLSRCHGAHRLLDVGYAHASPAYLAALADPSAMQLGEVFGVDLANRSVPGLRTAIGDLCSLPFKDAAFDVVTCISTLEHVGSDNRRYGVGRRLGQGTKRGALTELGRVLAPGGRLHVTVPFGEYEDHGWFVQYDERAWLELIRASDLVVQESEAFRHSDAGWVGVSRLDELAGVRYGDGVPGAKGVLCATLTTRP